VLVIVAMLSLAAFTYSELMLSEYEAAIRTGRIAETRMYAESGVEYVLSLAALRNSEEPPDLFNNPDELHLVQVQAGTEERPAGYFSVVVPVPEATGETTFRYGLRNESAKLNLNALAESALTEDEARLFLMEIPYMTESTADAILDWIDANEDPRFYGVEAPFYAEIFSSKTPKNAPLQSIDELLAVEGVTVDLLYGEDTNRNGILDENEDDGATTEPYDNADGILDTGWADYLTVTARESNLRLDGSTKIPLNTNTLTDLYDQLEEEFGEEIATFIVAYRIFGPADDLDRLETPAGLTGSDTSSLTADEQAQISEVTNAIASVFSGGGEVTRNGLDLSGGGSYEIRSLYDLVDTEVEAEFEDGPQTLVSPWSSAGGSLAESFPDMKEALGITTDTYIEGRINVNEARFETLMGIPTMTEEIADAMLAANQQLASGGPDPDLVASRATNCWLLVEGIVDLETMRQLDPYVTGGGDVLSGQVIGYLGTSGISSRLQVVIDASESPPKLLSITDLSELGPGYSLFDWQQEVSP
jgi:hypothetical protein